jgi:hypothetical protein
MIGGGRGPNGLLLLAALGALAGCSVEVPSFLGRESGGGASYSLRGEPLPDPVAVPLREAALDRGLYGVVLRVHGPAPTQGYFGAQLRPINNAVPDAAGISSFEFVALPPSSPQAIGPERTRELSAAVFVPTLALNELRGFRVGGAGTTQTVTLR